MKWESVEVGDRDRGRCAWQSAAGVNYIDVYQRSGLYKLPLPFGRGLGGRRRGGGRRPRRDRLQGRATAAPMPVPWAATRRSA